MSFVLYRYFSHPSSCIRSKERPSLLPSVLPLASLLAISVFHLLNAWELSLILLLLKVDQWMTLDRLMRELTPQLYPDLFHLFAPLFSLILIVTGG